MECPSVSERGPRTSFTRSLIQDFPHRAPDFWFEFKDWHVFMDVSYAVIKDAPDAGPARSEKKGRKDAWHRELRWALQGRRAMIIQGDRKWG